MSNAATLDESAAEALRHLADSIPGYAALLKERERVGSEVPVVTHWDEEQRAKGIMPPGYEGARLRLRFIHDLNLLPTDFEKRPALARKRVKEARKSMPPRSRLVKREMWPVLIGRREATTAEALDCAWSEYNGSGGVFWGADAEWYR